jgi:putative transposase
VKNDVKTYGIKYRCYPTKEQEQYIKELFGTRKFFWNKTLEKYHRLYKQNKEIKKFNETAKEEEKKELIQYNLLCGNIANVRIYNIKSVIEEGINMVDDDGNPSPRDYSWLKDYHSTLYQQVILDLGRAWRTYYSYLKNKVTNPSLNKVGVPKKMKRNNSVRLQNTGILVDGKNVIDWKRGLIKTPGFRKLGYLKCVLDRRFYGKVKETTISRDIDNKYYVSLTIEEEVGYKEPNGEVTPNSVIGIDFGLKTFATIDNASAKDESFKINPNVYSKILELEEKKKELQRKQSNCEVTFSREKSEPYTIKLKDLNKKSRKGWHQERSKGWKAYQREINKITVKINNIKRNFIGNFASQIVNNDDTNAVCVETLSLRDMTIRNKTKTAEHKRISKKVKFRRAMARKFSEYAIGEAIKQLEYDCKKEGKYFVKVPRYYASTKTCSCCGYKLTDIDLDVREWVCPNCGTKHDRDGNAAKNLAKHAFAELSSELPTS